MPARQRYKGALDSLVMESKHRVRDLERIATRRYPGYLVDFVTDSKDMPEYHDVNKTERQAYMTELGLATLQYHEGLLKLKALWDELRHSSIGISPEFRQLSRKYTDYHFIHPDKGKGEVYCTKDVKSLISEIAEGIRLNLGDVGCMALTFGAKQVCDTNGGKDALTRSILYDEIAEEIENFNKFIERQQMILTLCFCEITEWDKPCNIIVYKQKWG